MTPDEREKMNELCMRIGSEKDPQIVNRLVEELNDLTAGEHERSHPAHKLFPLRRMLRKMARYD
jgi:hypothetical protein